MDSTKSRDGTQIGFEVTGSGPPLLLVHGTTADRTRWGAVVPRFEEHFTVYAIDRRGRGASSDSHPYSLAREAEDIAAVVDAVDEPTRILAHSYGAVCALESALLTDGIDRMVLYEPPIPTGIPMYPPDLPDRMQSLIDGGESEAALEVFFREVVRMPEDELSQYRRLPVWPTRIELAPTIPRELAIDRSYTFDAAKFGDVRVPALLLLGGDSPDLFSAAVEAVYQALRDSTVVILPGQQHIAMDTAPDLFMNAVLEFII